MVVTALRAAALGRYRPTIELAALAELEWHKAPPHPEVAVQELSPMRDNPNQRSHDVIGEDMLRPAALSGATDQREQSLEYLFNGATTMAESKMRWYLSKKRAKKRASLILRAAAIMLASGGGLCPLLQGTIADIDFKSLGYLLLAAAAAMAVFDRLFGLSSSWMRFMQAAQSIERELDLFRLQWALQSVTQTAGSSDAYMHHRLALLKDFVEDVHQIVQSETDLWLDEFRSNLTHMERAINSKSGTDSSADR